MVLGFYEYTDEWGKRYHLSCRIGGFKHEQQAVAAIKRRGGVGYTTDHRNVLLNIVRNGQIVRIENENVDQTFLRVGHVDGSINNRQCG